MQAIYGFPVSSETEQHPPHPIPRLGNPAHGVAGSASCVRHCYFDCLLVNMLKGKPACSVVGCNTPHKSLHHVPTSDPLKTQWMDFIFAGAVPRHVSKYLLVCANHFTTECFVNQGQYLAGYASYLKLNIGSIPTVRDASGDPEAVRFLFFPFFIILFIRAGLLDGVSMQCG